MLLDTDLLEVSNSHNVAVIFFFGCLVIIADFDKVSFYWYCEASLLYLLLQIYFTAFSDDGFAVSRNIRLIWRNLCFAFVESSKYQMWTKWIYSEYPLYCISLSYRMVQDIGRIFELIILNYIKQQHFQGV